MRTLKPFILLPKYYTPLEKEILATFKAIVWKPIVDSLFKSTAETLMFNSEDSLEDAIRYGEVEYRDGVFTGKFSAKISKALIALGAKWDGRVKGWRFEGNLPPGLALVIAQSEVDLGNTVSSLLRTLDGLANNIPSTDINFDDPIQQAMNRMDAEFQSRVKSISIAPELTAGMVKAIAEEWSQNLNLYVKDWMTTAVLDLRQQVQAHVFAGGRASGLVKMIEHTYNVSHNKAKFLARQETSLLMSKFQEERYKSIGIMKYRWSTSHDERVRHTHEELDAKVFEWGSPPVVDSKGRRRNPGEDYNCRCVAVPIVEY